MEPTLLFELPTRCEYWSWKRVKKFLDVYGMEKKRQFDGCRVGTKDKYGDLLRKQWALASNSPAYSVFSKLKCKGDHVHGSSRGKHFKDAENYTYKMTNMIHKIFQQSS